MGVTRSEFHRLALSFPETEERSHMNHPDFRTPVEQRMFVEAESKAFDPCSGAWGRRGATSVRLATVKKTTLRRALTSAWELAAPNHLRAGRPKTAGAPR